MRQAYTIRDIGGELHEYRIASIQWQNKLTQWAVRISECRENGICEQSYYRWQKRLFEMSKAEQGVQFAEVTQPQSVPTGNVAVTIRLGGMEADIHSGADAGTVETVLRILRSC